MLLTPAPARAPAIQPGYPPMLYPARDGGPALDIAFAYGQWDPRIAFTRASAGYYTNADGTMRLVPSGVPRTGDRGLLVEGARTNLSLNSGDIGGVSDSKNVTVTADQAVAPDGTTSGNQLEDTDNSSVRETNQAITVANDSAIYTGSIFLKAGTIGTDAGIRLALSGGTGVNVDLTIDLATGIITSGTGTIEPYGNDWYRVACAITNNASGNTTLTMRTYPSRTAATTGTIYAWGRQIEAGFPATSYIPTIGNDAGDTATRAADVAVIDLADLPAFDAGQGTMSGDYAFAGWDAVVANVVVSLNDATTDNRIDITHPGGVNAGHPQMVVRASASNSANIVNADAVATAAVHRACAAWDLAGAAFALNGARVGEDMSVTLPAVSQLALGSFGTGSGYLHGHIRRVAYWPQRLPDSALQGLTA